MAHQSHGKIHLLYVSSSSSGQVEKDREDHLPAHTTHMPSAALPTYPQAFLPFFTCCITLPLLPPASVALPSFTFLPTPQFLTLPAVPCTPALPALPGGGGDSGGEEPLAYLPTTNGGGGRKSGETTTCLHCTHYTILLPFPVPLHTLPFPTHTHTTCQWQSFSDDRWREEEGLTVSCRPPCPAATTYHLPASPTPLLLPVHCHSGTGRKFYTLRASLVGCSVYTATYLPTTSPETAGDG